MTPRSFEELASQWTPRAKRFLSLVGRSITVRVERRLPGILTGSAFLLVAVFCVGGLGAWFSVAAWMSVRERGYTASGSALVVAGIYAVLALLFYVAARFRAARPSPRSSVVVEPDAEEIEEAGQELVTLFKDLTIAAKRSISPNEVLKPHAVKLVVATTALGFLVALNLSTRKEMTK